MPTSKHAPQIRLVQAAPAGTVHASISMTGPDEAEHEPPPQTGVVHVRTCVPLVSHVIVVSGVHVP
jgi:hypothetical protein